MQPCPESLVTSATHRVTWNDSHGVPNVAHAGPSSLGPMVPIVAREATLALWRALAADDGLAARIARLDSGARRVLEATTTDVEPLEIFRIGVEATARTLVQHGYIAGQTPYHTPAQFARGLRDSGIFAVVAGTWYWELQASTFRRGMIPVSFVPGPDATVRYPPDSATMLRAMKEATIGRAHAVMAKAVTEEKLTVAEAVQKYYHELDLIAKQYALLPEGEQPRCLGQMAHTIDGQRFSVQPGVVAAYVETFVRLLTMVQITLIPGLPEEEIADPEERTLPYPGHELQALPGHHHHPARVDGRSCGGDRPGDQARGGKLPDGRGARARLRCHPGRGLHGRPAPMTELPPRIHPLVRGFLADAAAPAGCWRDGARP